MPDAARGRLEGEFILDAWTFEEATMDFWSASRGTIIVHIDDAPKPDFANLVTALKAAMPENQVRFKATLDFTKGADGRPVGFYLAAVDGSSLSQVPVGFLRLA